ANLANAGIVTARTTIPEFVELGTTIQDDPCIVRHSNEVVAAQSARIPLREEYSAYIEENITEGPACHGNRLDMLSNSTLNPLSTMEHVHSSDVEDAVEIEHPLILSGVDSIPFTYLACLFAKWTTEKDKIPQIHRRIKCFLTGVKGFQFKERRTYELSVYVDDGSLISEVLIDHKVVQNGIGHSPEEVTAALSSTEKRIVADMRETMKKFQLFLAKFEVVLFCDNLNLIFSH
ncbi:recQ-mediated genome instability protein 1-like, partial [Curcuma longa]|uniref:recQ-mediated genome instability protein 1-like n=1 Tax=Curcuma longa TaxID=136217 RepID=UPI003D9E26D6